MRIYCGTKQFTQQHLQAIYYAAAALRNDQGGLSLWADGRVDEVKADTLVSPYLTRKHITGRK